MKEFQLLARVGCSSKLIFIFKHKIYHYTPPRGASMVNNCNKCPPPTLQAPLQPNVSTLHKQECISVGCIPSAAVAAGGGVGCISACTGQGGCIPACTRWGVSAQGSVCLGGLPQCMLGYTLPVDRMTDACKNITLLQLRCGR